MWLCGLRFGSRKKYKNVSTPAVSLGQYQAVHQPFQEGEVNGNGAGGTSGAKQGIGYRETDKLVDSLPKENYKSTDTVNADEWNKTSSVPRMHTPIQEQVVAINGTSTTKTVDENLKDGANKILGSDVKDVLVFDAARTVLYSNIPELDEGELPAIASVFADRSKAMLKGIILQGQRYEVHRYHPPCVYGRTEAETEQDSIGVALCKTCAAGGEMTVFALITYEMPALSARMVPQLQLFCKDIVEPLQQWWFIN